MKKSNWCIWAVQKGLYGLMDEHERWLISPRYLDVRHAEDYKCFNRNGWALAQSRDSKLYGFVDIEGNWVIQPCFQNAGNFEYNDSLVEAQSAENNLWGIIDKTGKWVIQPQFADVGYIGENGRFVVYVNRKPYGRYDAYNNCWVSSLPENGSSACLESVKDMASEKHDENSSENMNIRIARFEDNGLYGVIDDLDNWVVKPVYRNAFPFDGMFSKTQSNENGCWGLINKWGEWVLKPEYVSLDDLSGFNIHSDQNENGLYGFVDNEGRWIIKPQFYEVGEFEENGLAVVQSAENYLVGFIDLKGRWAIEPKYGEDTQFFDWWRYDE